jgi:serine/threonine-protein kinase
MVLRVYSAVVRNRPAAMDLGDKRFAVDTVVGEGGTARVFRGREVKSGKTVAVKVLRRHLVDNEEVVARFQLEADLFERFDHPNILPLLGRGITPQGAPWFACTYAPMGSLADQMLRNGVLPRADLLSYVAEILDALHYLHEQGIVHRDVKPGNVLVDEDNVALLCDFGIALAPERRATIVGDRMGTPSFMPPEQYADPRSVTPQADLFGAGVTLYVGLTGQTGMMLLVEEMREQALAALPEHIAPIVDKATSLRVEDRYQTAWEMSLDLADVLEES